jgi:ABC-2 type transport system permease protein
MSGRALLAGKPGGLWWLYRHEWRLNWRGTGGKKIWLLAACLAVLWALLHFAAWKALGAALGAELPPMAYVALGGGFWFFFFIMLSQSIAHAVVAVFDRGDFDLLMSSPLPARHVLAVRGLGIASGAILLPAALLLPAAHMGLVMDRPALMAIYPALVATGLMAAAAGLAFTLVLVSLFGARRAKTIAQVMAAFFGAGVFLATQAQTFLSKDTRQSLLAWARNEAEAGMLSPDSPLWWPVRAMLGEAVPLLAMIALSAGAFVAVVRIMQRRFAAGAQETMTGGATMRVAGNAPIRFTTGVWRLMLMKEWRLLARDPHIISQTLLQLLYLLPMMFLAFRTEKAAFLIIPGFVVIASMLAGNLAWLTVAAEDAPELIGVSPVPMARLRWIKAAAAVLPASLFVIPVALWWLPRDAYAAGVLLLCGAGGLISAALCQVWNPRRGDRKNMNARYRENRLINFVEAFTSFGWAGLAVCLNGYLIFAPIALVFCLLGPAAAWVVGRSARKEQVL